MSLRPTARARRLLPTAALVAVAVGLGACGIPVSQSAQPASSRDLPSQLSQVGVPTTTVPKPPHVAASHSNHLEIFLLNRSGTHLVAVRRSWSGHITPQIALGVLALGPYPSDAKDGLQSDLAQGAAAPKVEAVSKSGIATVRLDESTFVSLVGASLYIPLAQVVFTLMSNFSYIKGVEFYLAVNPPELFNYTPDGFNEPSPVTVQTYATLKPVNVPTKKKSS